jgi:hypothetical protein
MKILVTGSRTYNDPTLMANILHHLKPTVIIHGGANGADRLAHQWAQSSGVMTITYRPDWNKHGKAAGIIRNETMFLSSKPDLVVAFWDGKSRGTKHMIDFATKHGAKVDVIFFTPDSPKITKQLELIGNLGAEGS